MLHFYYGLQSIAGMVNRNYKISIGFHTERFSCCWKVCPHTGS